MVHELETELILANADVSAFYYFEEENNQISEKMNSKCNEIILEETIYFLSYTENTRFSGLRSLTSTNINKKR